MSRAASPSDLVAAARAAGIADARVLAAISATPRAGFVPADYVTDAYRDEQPPRSCPPTHVLLAQGGEPAETVGAEERGLGDGDVEDALGLSDELGLSDALGLGDELGPVTARFLPGPA